MGDKELIKIGIIGTGTYGRTHLNALSQRQRLSGDVELVGFAEINPQTRQSMGFTATGHTLSLSRKRSRMPFVLLRRTIFTTT